jgi:acyl-CoA synthetase (AMP-forming)/AMP-acid ligase II
MLYTSGTTSRPKGVILSTSALTAQIDDLLTAWRYRPSDHLLHLLPLHHIHGLVPALLAPLVAGSTIEFLHPFNPTSVWARLAAPFLPNPTRSPISMLTAVPTIYSRLLASHASLAPHLHAPTVTALSTKHLRLAISGSAPLPTPTASAFTSLSRGSSLLERYGMTETGMALSTTLAPATHVPSSVGWPLPSISARLVPPTSDSPLPPLTTETEGEIQLRGPGLLTAYWRKPTDAFVAADPSDPDQTPWFKTGDVGVRRNVPDAERHADADWAKGPMWFILGRASVDIIKTGGEKVSALEVERELLGLEEVKECAVVGLKSERWGEKVAAVVVMDQEWATRGKGGDLEAQGSSRTGTRRSAALHLRRKLKDRLSPWKIPQVVEVVPQLKRNAMGKVDKKALIKDTFGD